jgi:fucose permease
VGAATAHVVPARTAVAVVFALNGLAFATWVSRIPESQAALGLTPGALGRLLLALAAGAVFALPAAGAVTSRLGPGRTVRTGALVGTLGLALAGLGAAALGSVPLTAAGLFLLGLGSGTWDVAMNVEGAAVERLLRRTVMPRFHAAFSLGAVAGAGLGAAASQGGVPVDAHLAATAVAVAVATAFASGRFLPVPAPGPEAAAASEHPRRSALDAWREPRTLLIGVLVLAMAFTEGTANDWLSVALVDGYGVSPAVGALGFAVFVAAMTAGRMWGTLALDRWGRLPVLYTTVAVAAAGVLLVVLAGSLPLALAGAVLWGLGVSLGFPVGMSAAADSGEDAAARVSVVATIGYTAFLAGPPLLGFLGDHVGVLRALTVVAVLLVPALAVVGAARPPEPGHRGDRHRH